MKLASFFIALIFLCGCRESVEKSDAVEITPIGRPTFLIQSAQFPSTYTVEDGADLWRVQTIEVDFVRNQATFLGFVGPRNGSAQATSFEVDRYLSGVFAASLKSKLQAIELCRTRYPSGRMSTLAYFIGKDPSLLAGGGNVLLLENQFSSDASEFVGACDLENLESIARELDVIF